MTGATQPVGQAIIYELAAHGAASIYGMASPLPSVRQSPHEQLLTFPPSACDKTANSDTYQTLTASITKDHPNTKLIPYPFNIAKEEDTVTLIDEVLNAFGRLDIWVCSSGLLGPPSIHDTTPDDLQRCFETHSMAPFFALKYAPPAMAKQLTEKQAYPNAAPKTQNYGSIIVISSVASTYGGCWGPCYTMSAHAALGVVRAGVAVLKGTGVRINAISPGQVDVGVDLNGVSLGDRGVKSSSMTDWLTDWLTSL